MQRDLMAYHPMTIMLKMSAAYWQNVFEMQSSMLKLWTDSPSDALAAAEKHLASDTDSRLKSSDRNNNARDFAGEDVDSESPQPV